jgi:preprotein translocase subunit SecE
MMQRQGQVEADGSPAQRKVPPTPRQRPAGQQDLTFAARVGEFFREVRTELRLVTWPNREEVVNSASVVLVTLIILVSLIFGLNWLFSHSETFLFS